VLIASSLSAFANKRQVKVSSPDGKIVVLINPGNKLNYEISYKGEAIVSTSELSITLATGQVLGKDADVKERKDRTVNTQVKGNLYKKSLMLNLFNETELEFDGGYGLIVRVFNNGVAYRWVTTLKGRIKILGEQSDINLQANTKLFACYAKSKDLFCSFENFYDTLPIARLDTSKVINLPLLASSPKGTRVLITESDLQDYPGWNLKSDKPGQSSLKGIFAPVVTAIKGMSTVYGKPEYDMTRPTKRENYIAETDGNRHFPWRTFTITDQDTALVNSDLVYLLARPSLIEDMSWIKPGKAAWEWWSNINIWGVNFKAGVNTATYKYYIDYAAANQIEYVLLDEGWSKSLGTLMEVVPEVNIEELAAYAKSKNVGLFLWGTGYAFDKESEAIMSKYSKLGIKGFKIDFMDRDDQYMVNFYERTLKEAAKYKLMIDFHGAFKPTGLSRTWPNEVGREGIMGNENNKWSNISPYQQILNSFIRFVAGHADFTPGGMLNANESEFRSVWGHPMVKGTRCHQMAMYMLYHAPFQMLCESPKYYVADQPIQQFLSEVPTVWDEQLVLAAELGKHVLVAKRKGEKWFIGGMCDKSVELDLNLSFLGKGQFDLRHYADGINANKNATDYQLTTTTTNAKASIKVQMVRGGGVFMVITPQ
jgi:alpha-glucosidase